ncbi:Eco57I restriction-modification methylase domain-containing protein [Mycobacterium sp. G7A2]|uniref:Eco57I restriction-modification methylase domain-containing protein n=1 Tax=Mycobacterium sp. G7A2 TaxID=3317307 RepID=UPI0035A8328C
MTEQAAYTLHNRNPDVLTCIANLSNDEVFTPPEFANQMLDLVADAWADANGGANIWADRSVTFLDPFTKSGVFLREITKRLTDGLRDEIPDLQKRVDHILVNQVFGIGITQITSLIARRSVYCSKSASGTHSIAPSFTSEVGNIWFEPLEHSWVGATEFVETADNNGKPVTKGTNGRCKYCGANQKNFDRAEGLETHAYAFIHADDIKARMAELFGDNMHFDVIIGNPPYQLSDGGYGTSAAPIYHLFVQQAKKLEPRYLTMVVPARWFAGGKGLDDFRESMLSDKRLRVIEDYPDSNDVFPGTQVKGGVCFFLWDRDAEGDVRVTTHDKGTVLSSASRPLLEPGADIFIRYNEGVSILKKVMEVETGATSPLVLPKEKQFSALVSSRKPFGFDTTFRGKTEKSKGDLRLYRNGGVGYVPRSEVSHGIDVIDRWKVFLAYAGSGSDSFPHPILPKPFVGEPGSVSSETYLYIGPLASEEQAKNVCTYIATRLVRFLVLLHKPSQHATRPVYTFVPMQDFSKPWSDDQLYAKYGITDDEIAFIESMVRPMDLSSE